MGYQVVDLGTLPRSSGSVAIAINDKSQVLCSATVTSSALNDPTQQAFVWEKGTLHVLGTFDALGMNNNGQVVGSQSVKMLPSSRMPFTITACLYRNGILRKLPTYPNAILSKASAINDRGFIVGNIITDRPLAEIAYSWGSPALKLTPPADFVSCEVCAINNNNQVAGEAKGQLPAMASYSEAGVCAVLWDRSQGLPLKALPGYEGSRAAAINIKSHVVGHSLVTSQKPNTLMRACLWGDNQVIDLGALTRNGRSLALGINDHAQVVGTAEVHSSSYMHAFLWENGKMFDLNRQIGSETGWRLTTAKSINNAGEIVCNGVRGNSVHAVLLIPKS